MANKRLVFNISEDLHSRLKAEAAQKGITLGAHCAAILGGEASAPPSIENLDRSTLASMPIPALRELCSSLSETQPTNWQRQVNMINFELQRRYKIR